MKARGVVCRAAVERSAFVFFLGKRDSKNEKKKKNKPCLLHSKWKADLEKKISNSHTVF